MCWNLNSCAASLGLSLVPQFLAYFLTHPMWIPIYITPRSSNHIPVAENFTFYELYVVFAVLPLWPDKRCMILYCTVKYCKISWLIQYWSRSPYVRWCSTASKNIGKSWEILYVLWISCSPNEPRPGMVHLRLHLGIQRASTAVGCGRPLGS
jgi:hypothetical protein